MDPMLGEIRMFAFDKEMRGWLPCDGRLLPVQQYQALYSLLGMRFGGNGQTTFALPDLRGRVPVHRDPQGTIAIGQTQGTEQVALTIAEIPNHTHKIPVIGATATTATPAQGILAETAATRPLYSDASSDTAMAAKAIQTVGNGQGHSNMQPFTVIGFQICTSGYFPQQP